MKFYSWVAGCWLARRMHLAKRARNFSVTISRVPFAALPAKITSGLGQRQKPRGNLDEDSWPFRTDILPTALCANHPFGARGEKGEENRGNMYVTYCSWLCMRGSHWCEEDRADRSRVFRACFCPSRAIATANYKISFPREIYIARYRWDTLYSLGWNVSRKIFHSKLCCHDIKANIFSPLVPSNKFI